MKRFLVRMSVLALVVVLGWIAIAQAQRGAKEASETSDEARAAASADEGSPRPTLSSPSGGQAPRSGTSESGANPLRGSSGRLSFTELASVAASGANHGIKPSTAELRDGPAASQAGPAAPTVLAVQAPDPFARRTDATPSDPSPAPSAVYTAFAPVSSGVNSPTSAPAGAAAAQNGGPELPMSGPAARPPLVSSAADSNVKAFGNDASVVATAPTAPGASVATPTARPAGDTVPRDRAAEPAPFKLDPSTPSNSLPLGTASVGRAVPGAAPGQGDSTPSNAASGSGKPGSRQLEGPQTPALTVEKSGPPETQVGKTATFQTKIRNSGQIAAQGVEVRDEVPKGTKLVATNPRASQGVGGELVWQLGTIKPGEEVAVEMQVMPLEEGEIGSVATVHFRAEASVRTIATKPELAIKASGPGQVSIGEEIALTILVSNPGTGSASSVVLEAKIPPGLRHPAGADLEYEIGSLKPKESRQMELRLAAVEPGAANLPLIARGDANLKADARFDMEVIAPRLEVAMEGPKRRFLEREAKYILSISNPGTAPARQVQLMCQLPPGLQFVNANNAGQYEPTTRTVHWLLEELPVRETGKVELTTMPTEAGEQKLLIRGAAEKGVAAEKEQPVLVEGVAAISFTLAGLLNPIVRGSETTYEVRVINQGSKAASNVRVSFLLPTEMRAVAAEGPSRFQIDANRVVFEGLARLAPKAETTYRVRVQGLQPGDLRVRAQLLTDEIQTPVTKEESTRVYSDE